MIIIKTNNKDQELNEIKCTYIKIIVLNEIICTYIKMIEINEKKMYVH